MIKDILASRVRPKRKINWHQIQNGTKNSQKKDHLLNDLYTFIKKYNRVVVRKDKK